MKRLISADTTQIEPFLDIGLETMCVEVAATVGERT
jgi:hypothetical protein